MSQDPFSDPAELPNVFPNQKSLIGRVCIFRPVKADPNHTSTHKPEPHLQLEVDITVVDGAGPVVRDGNALDGDEFKSVYINADRPAKQLMDAYRSQSAVIGVLNLPNPNMPPGKGNSYNLDSATDAQKQKAREYLANRTVGQAAAPAAAPAEGNPFA